jgi:hypothetical protein
VKRTVSATSTKATNADVAVFLRLLGEPVPIINNKASARASVNACVCVCVCVCV